MKKYYFLLLLFAHGVFCWSADFGILVNGVTYKVGTYNPEPLDKSFEEYFVLNVSLVVNDYVQIYDNENKAAWVVNLDPSSVSGITKREDRYVCSSAGCYDFYIKIKLNSDQLYIGAGSACNESLGGAEEPETPSSDDTKKWETAVPANCEDVMMQCFYWNSYQDEAYGNTKWSTLTNQMEEITPYFDMIWLPPSAQSDGGLGYHPEKLSNQNCALGSESELKNLIAICHANNTKVIADVVVNHRWNVSSWCDFYSEDFGKYGQFQLTKEHICSDDEVWWDATDAECKTGTRGAEDTGEKYAAARDLDHTSPYVQQLVKAYLDFLQQTIGYDGFRWDVAKGFSSSIFGNYIAYAQPYFSVGEYFDYSYDALKGWVDGTGKRSAVFDFAGKSNGFHSAFIDGQAPNLLNLIYAGQPRGLIGAEYRRYSVTFIDNHDTFERDDAQDKEFLGYKKSMTAANKTNVLMANAWLLSMPGVPCVFYPHWAKYKDEIKPMIVARKTAGVHNMSAVSIEESANDKIIATITGSKCKMILKLGSGAGCDVVPTGYKKLASGTNYAMFVENSVSDYDPQPALSVSFSPQAGTFTSAQSVTLSANKENTQIYYTTNGEEPTTASSLYSQAIPIDSSTTIKAIAVQENESSRVFTASYVIVAADEFFTVATTKPAEWSSINLYAWLTNNEQPLGVWPGTTLQANDSGWYTFTFSPTQRPINIIWNDGTNQTQNLEGVYETTCYSIVSNKASVNSNCPYIKNSESDSSITPKPNPDTSVSQQIQSEPNIDWKKPVFNVLGTRIGKSYQGIVLQERKKYLNR